MACRTCDMIRGLLLSQGAPAPLVSALMPAVAAGEAIVVAKTKKKVSAYSRRYGRAFKKIAKRYQKKSGGWMKNGFQRCQHESHRIAKRG